MLTLLFFFLANEKIHPEPLVHPEVIGSSYAPNIDCIRKIHLTNSLLHGFDKKKKITFFFSVSIQSFCWRLSWCWKNPVCTIRKTKWRLSQKTHKKISLLFICFRIFSCSIFRKLVCLLNFSSLVIINLSPNRSRFFSTTNKKISAVSNRHTEIKTQFDTHEFFFLNSF